MVQLRDRSRLKQPTKIADADTTSAELSTRAKRRLSFGDKDDEEERRESVASLPKRKLSFAKAENLDKGKGSKREKADTVEKDGESPGDRTRGSRTSLRKSVKKVDAVEKDGESSGDKTRASRTTPRKSIGIKSTQEKEPKTPKTKATPNETEVLPKRRKSVSFTPDTENSSVKKRRKASPHHNESIFMLVYRHPNSMRAIVTDWVNGLSEDKRGTTADLLNFVVMSAKNDQEIASQCLHADDLQKDAKEATEILGKIVEDVVSCQIPTLLKKEKSSRQFKKAIGEFFRRCVRECPEDFINDEETWETIIQWLQRVSVLRSVSLRFAAALASYGLMDGIHDVITRTNESLSSLERQLASEKSKNKSTRSPGSKQVYLEQKIQQFTEQAQSLTEWSQRIYSDVFVLRQRDSFHSIRSLSATALGQWMTDNRPLFSSETHLKYLGWLLADKMPSVRASVLAALIKHTRQEESLSMLENFARRYSKRIVEMRFDKDSEVAEKAVKLCTELLRLGLLSSSEQKQVVAAVGYELNHTNMKAVGAFIVKFLDNQIRAENREQGATESAAATASSPDSGRQLRDRRASRDDTVDPGEDKRRKCTELVRLLASPELKEQHFLSGVMSSIDDDFPLVGYWSNLIPLLLEEELTTTENAICARILSLAAHIILHGDKKLARKSTVASTEEIKAKASDALVENSERLFEKFKDDLVVTQLLMATYAELDMSHFMRAGLEAECKEIISKAISCLRLHARHDEVSRSAWKFLLNCMAEPLLQDDAKSTVNKFMSDNEVSLNLLLEKEVAQFSSGIESLLPQLQIAFEMTDFPLQPSMVEAMITLHEKVSALPRLNKQSLMDILGVTFTVFTSLLSDLVNREQSGDENASFDRLSRYLHSFWKLVEKVLESDRDTGVRDRILNISLEMMSATSGASSILSKSNRAEASEQLGIYLAEYAPRAALILQGETNTPKMEEMLSLLPLAPEGPVDSVSAALNESSPVRV